MEKDKLDIKRTMYIGCAFFTIMLLWQVYNYTTPLFLDEMQISDTWKGVIMASDNLFALFMLPLFGKLSDKTNTKIGRRMPYIIVGTIFAAMVFPFMAVFAMKSMLIEMIIVFAFILGFMIMYRAPAVALMLDLTPKKHRSVANGIINLMGGIGGICAYLTIKLFFGNESTKILPFLITSALMILALIILYRNVKENKIEKQEEEVFDKKYKANLSKEQKRSLIFILLAVFCWFFGVNAVETFWSTYSVNVLGAPNEGSGAIALLIFTVASIAMYLPAGIIATKIGRRKTVLFGIVAIFIAFALAYIFRQWEVLSLIILFIFAGLGWATINVNSYPMVVEMANETNGGQFTGYYYTSSMLAQSLTPVVAGFLMDNINRSILFPYATSFLAISFVFILLSKEKKV